MNSEKIESVLIEINSDNIMSDTMTTDTATQSIKPKYLVEPELNYCSIVYNDKRYILDVKQFNLILNFDKNFKLYNETDDYPAYSINNKKINLLEFLYKLYANNYIYIFKNNNKYDLREENISIIDNNFKTLVEKYNVIEFMNNAILITMGKYAGQYKNPMCKILNKNNEVELLMLCNQDKLCKLCNKSYEKILDYEKANDDIKIVWSYNANGYILGNNNLFIHQIITGCHGNGKGTKNISVDHIDQDPLNNTFANLRIATRKDQENNSKGIKEGTKRARNHNAKALPEGITQDMMKKYVVYYRECYDKEKDLHREFFKIETHPKLDKPYISSKSNKVSIQDKLVDVNKIIMDLDNDIHPDKNEDKLPTYISLKIARDKPHLIFDKRGDDGQRMNVRMVLKPDYNLDDELVKFREKIKAKYDIVL